MGLGKFLKEVSLETTLKGLISEYFYEERKLDYPSIEKDSYFRASGTAYLCPREEVICNLAKISDRDSYTDTSTMITYSHGHGLHYAMQNKILPAVGALIGTWICLGCGAMHGLPKGTKPLSEMLVKRPAYCNASLKSNSEFLTEDKPKHEKCNYKEFYYHELYFKDDTYRIGGHPDGFLQIPGRQGLGLLEVKSAHSFSASKAKSGPFLEHIVQANVYMWLTRCDWTTFIYWDKGGNGLNSLIEHTITRDDKLIKDIKNTLKSIWQGIESETLPDRKICKDSECSRAKKCKVADLCFASTNKLINIRNK